MKETEATPGGGSTVEQSVLLGLCPCGIFFPSKSVLFLLYYFSQLFSPVNTKLRYLHVASSCRGCEAGAQPTKVLVSFLAESHHDLPRGEWHYLVCGVRTIFLHNLMSLSTLHTKIFTRGLGIESVFNFVVFS